MAKNPTTMASDSSLSPPPADLAVNSEAVITESITNGKKRKTEMTVKTVKRTKQTHAPHADSEVVFNGMEEAPKPKRRAAKKAIVEDESFKDEAKIADGDEAEMKTTVKKAIKHTKKGNDNYNDNGNDNMEAEVEVKKKVVKRKPKAVKDEAPLADRTKDIKLRMGAHVSAAGG